MSSSDACDSDDAEHLDAAPHDLGPAPVRITVDAALVRTLVGAQFPHWADLPVRPVTDGGWDNQTFHLGTDLLVRVPSAAEYALAVDKEHRWLPLLAARLPQPVPRPVARGAPAGGCPFPWSVYAWLPGTPATFEQIACPTGFAEDLADVVAALRGVDTDGGPQPGRHNWYRGGTLRTFQGLLDAALHELEGRLDADLAREIWRTALRARWDGVDRWFHGDLARGNLLLADGHLAAVLDFGTCGVGDPACDLAIAWTLLTADGRRAFRRRLHVDEDEWARGRGWALWKTLTLCASSLGDPGPVASDAARALTEIFSEFELSRQ